MPDKNSLDFQTAVDEYLIRHRSVLDIMTKFQEASARVNRAFAKAVTECGCVEVNATRQHAPPGTEYRNVRQFMSSHLSNKPCSHCQEVLSKEMGHCLFYLAALCNLTGLDLNQVMESECKNVNTLGVFHLS